MRRRREPAPQQGASTAAGRQQRTSSVPAPASAAAAHPGSTRGCSCPCRLHTMQAGRLGRDYNNTCAASVLHQLPLSHPLPHNAADCTVPGPSQAPPSSTHMTRAAGAPRRQPGRRSSLRRVGDGVSRVQRARLHQGWVGGGGVWSTDPSIEQGGEPGAAPACRPAAAAADKQVLTAPAAGTPPGAAPPADHPRMLLMKSTSYWNSWSAG